MSHLSKVFYIFNDYAVYFTNVCFLTDLMAMRAATNMATAMKGCPCDKAMPLADGHGRCVLCLGLDHAKA